MLGCVAAVIAMVSPSQPSPAVIQSMWISFIGSGVASATRPWSVEIAMRFPLWKPDLPCRVIRCVAKSPVVGSASPRLYRIKRDVSGFILTPGEARIRPGTT